MPDEMPGWGPQPLMTGGTRKRCRQRQFRTSVLALCTMAVFASSESGRTQQVDQPRLRITIAPVIAARPASRGLLTIKVGPPEALSNKYFVTLRGLPPRVTLAGWEAHSGAWTIPLLAVQTRDTLVLEPDIPADVSGRADIVITVVTIDGSLLAEARTTLVIGPDTMLPTTEKTVAAPEQNQPSDTPDANAQTTSSPAPISGEVKMRAEKLVAQGEKYLADANIEVARQFFRRAADAGLASAALQLAATYDPAELAALQIEGVVPDRAEARRWYERARQLGAVDAESRLARLREN
jgi:hypothetical protein